MCADRLDEIEGRVDVLSLALQELLRQLAPEQSGKVREAIARLAERMSGISEPGPRDDGTAQEVGAMLTALSEARASASHETLT